MIFILNKNLEVVDNLSNVGEMSYMTPIIDDEYVQDLATGAETYTFTTMANTRQSLHLTVGNYVAFQYKKQYKLFNIIQIEEEHSEEFTKTVYCEMAGIELLNSIIRPMKVNGINAVTFLRTILMETSWQVGAVDVTIDDVIDYDITDYKNVYSIIQEVLVGKLGLEVSFSVDIKANRIRGKYVNLFVQRGADNGTRFSYSSNITSIVRKIDTSDIATALVGVGENNITFAELDLPDKPMGQDFIEDPIAYQRWSKNGYHILGVFKCDANSAQELVRLTRKELEKRSEPKFQYDLQTELLEQRESISIGDTVYIVDNEFNPPIRLTGRVSELRVSFVDPTTNSCVLSNFKEINSNITDEMKQMIDSKFPIGTGDIEDGAVTGDKIDTTYTSTLTADIIISGKVITEELIAEQAKITNAEIENLKAKDAEIENLKANVADIEELKAKDAEIENAQIENAEIVNAQIENLKVKVAEIDDLKVKDAEIENAIITNAEIVSAQIGSLKADVADIGTLVNGNLTSDNIHSLVLSSDKITVEDAFIKDAMIDNINANKINAGSVNTSKVTIQSENGSIKIADNTQQFKDANGVVRVQIGEDSTGQFSFAILDETGKGTLIDHTGVKEGALGNDIIKENMISEDAIGEKQIDYNSFSTGFNKETNTSVLNATKVKLDNQNQTLEVGFNQLKTQSDDTTSKTESNTTKLEVQQGQIQGLISDTTIEKDGESIKIKDAYSELEQTVDSFGVTIGEHTSKITEIGKKADSANENANNAITTANGLSGKITEVESSQSKLQQDLNGFKTTVSKDYTTKTELKATNDKLGTVEVEVNSTKSKVATIETNLNGITSRVGNVETTTSKLNTKVNNALDKPMNLYLYKNVAPSWSSNTTPDGELWLCGLNEDGKPHGKDGYFYSTVDGSKITVPYVSLNPNSVFPFGQELYICYSDRLWIAFYNKTEKKWKFADIIEGGFGTITNLTLNDSHQFLGYFIMASAEKVASASLYETALNYREATGQFTEMTSRMAYAESKITDDAITNTVSKSFYTKTETEGAITSKGYQTESQVQQKVDSFELKFQQSGGYNHIINSDFKRDIEKWSPTTDLKWSVNKGGLSSPSGYGVRLTGVMDASKFLVQYITDPKVVSNKSFTLSSYVYISSAGGTNPISDGANVAFRVYTRVTYTDDTKEYFYALNKKPSQVSINKWERYHVSFDIPENKKVKEITFSSEVKDTTRYMYLSQTMLESGKTLSPWSPNPNEVFDGVTTIDSDGITVSNSASNTHTRIDSSSFRVEDNKGGTVANFSVNSHIPNLVSGIIKADEVHAPNIASKSKYLGTDYIRYAVNGKTGDDNTGNGTSSKPFKTISRALLEITDKENRNIAFLINGGVTGFNVEGFMGAGTLKFYLEDDCIVNGHINILGSNNVIINGNSTKATIKGEMNIIGSNNIEVSWVSFRGDSKTYHNIGIERSSNIMVRLNDMGHVRSDGGCCIQTLHTNGLYVYGNIGSGLKNFIQTNGYSFINFPKDGTDTKVPDWTENLVLYNKDGGTSRVFGGGTFTKTPSNGWNPEYTPTSKTQTWNFDKIWSDETLNGWSNKNELIQGYYSGWDTGRWTGYMQTSDDFVGIKNTISGGTNLSGRIYIQRTTSTGNSTGSKLCLYGSDGTVITTTQTIDRGQGVWVALSSSIISKIQSGAIKYFYLKADSSNASTYFKCESNAKIEITYTK